MGESSTILKTTNGGGTWAAQTSGTTGQYLYSVHFNNAQTGWVVGSAGTILKTIDGGSNWVPQTSGTKRWLNSVHFSDTQTGWAVGDFTTLKTTNGGSTWIAQTSGTIQDLRSVHFIDAQTGWAVGEKILKTVNGGSTWTAQNSKVAGAISVHFTNAQTGWAVGPNGTILKYTPSTPSCLPSIPLHTRTNVPTDTKITWPNAPGCEDAYRLSLGTTPGGYDLLNNQIVADTAYQPAQPLPAGKTIYVRVVPYNGVGEASGCGEFSFVTAGSSLTIQCPASLTINLPPGQCESMYSYTVTGSDTIIQLSGLPTGAAFPLGTTVNVFKSEDQAGNSTTCSFSITVNDFANPVQNVICNDLIVCKVGNNCTYTISAGEVLEGGPYRCYDYYTVELDRTAPFGNGPWEPGILNPADIGKTFRVQVADPADPVNKRCWGNVKVEAAPSINIQNVLSNGLGGTFTLSGGLPQDNGSNFAAVTMSLQGNPAVTATLTNAPFTHNETVSFTCPQAGTYTVVATDASGCSGMTTVEVGGSSCNIYGLKVSTGNCTSDTTYTLTFDFKVQNINGATQFALTANSTPFGTYPLNTAQPLTIQNYPWDGGQTDLLKICLLNAGGNPTNCCRTIEYLVPGCLPSSTCNPRSDSLELVKLYIATDSANWKNKWDLTKPMKTWYGVFVNAEGCVTCLDLDGDANCNLLGFGGNGLKGVLPDINLPTVQKIYCGGNDLSNVIPDFTSLSNLKVFECSGNQLSGSIPNFTNLTNLQYFYCSGNQLSGSIPNFTNLPNLQKFDCSTNKLSGNIPNFTNLPNLIEFWCSYNNLSGSIPNFTNLPKLQLFSCRWNYLSDFIPDFKNLPDLQRFDCDLNQFTFEDVLPSYTIIQNKVKSNGGYYSYAPQDPVFHDTLLLRSPGQNLDFSLDFDETIPTNVYRWYKDGSYQPAQDQTGNNNLKINNLKTTDSGKWTVQVTNPDAPDLTLYSRTITLQVCSAAPAALSAPQGDTLTCTRTSLQLTSTGGASYAWSGGANSNNQTTVSSPGAYTVTVTYADGCTATASRTITENKVSPSASATGGVITCTQPDATLQAGSNAPNAIYIWSGGISNQQSTIVNQSGTYTVTVTNLQNGCSATATAEAVADNTPPSAQITAVNGAEITCAKPSATLQGSSNALNPIYNWSGGTISNNQSTISNPTTYTVTVTNPQNGCSSTNSISIADKRQQPNATATGGTINCGPAAAVELKGNSSTPGVSYKWSGGTNTNQASNTVTQAGTYTLTVTIDATGCTATATALASSASPPSALITAPQGKTLDCKTTTLSLSASGGDSYAWSGGLGSTAAVSINKSGTYTVTVSNSSTQCSATAVVSVGQNTTPPTAFAFANGTLTCTQKTAALLGSSGQIVDYAWTGPNNFSSTAQNPIVGTPGIYALTVTRQNNFCTASASAEVKGSPDLPTVTTTGGAITCLNPSVTLRAKSSIAGSGFLWRGPDGTFYSDTLIITSLPGLYALTVTSSPACSVTSTVTVVDNRTKPPFSASVLATDCVKKTAQLEANSPVPNATFQWSGPNGFSSSSPDVEVSTAGNYTLVISDPANGCTDSKTLLVGFGQATQPVISGLFTVCSGTPTLLQGSTGFAQYEWSNGQKTDKIQALVSGIYTLTVTDVAGCSATATAEVKHLTLPTALLLASEEIVCAGQDIGLSAGGGGLYRFIENGVPIGVFEAKSTLTRQVNQNTRFGVQVMDANGCTDSTAINEPVGSRSILVTARPAPNLAGASLAPLQDCPGKPLLITLNLPNCPDDSYLVAYQINGQAVKTANVTVTGGLGALDIGIQPKGTLVCNIVNMRTLGTNCVANYPPGKTLTIKVLPPLTGKLDTIICFTQSLVLHGKIYNQTGKYEVILPSKAGCDSTLFLDLNVVTKFNKTIVASFCENGHYVFYGDTLKNEGKYYKTRPGTQGCDTLVELNLNKAVSINSSQKRIICPGATYAVGDSIFNKKGFYQVFLKAKSGCDSVVNLTLDVHPLELSFKDSVVNACLNQSVLLAPLIKGCTGCKYQWSQGGASATKFVSAIGQQTYSITVTDANNCKLSASVQVNAQPSYNLEQEALLCPGDTIRVGSFTITKADKYPLNLQSQFGCVSIVTLTVKDFDARQIAARRDTLLLAPRSANGEAELTKNNQKPSTFVLKLIDTQGPKHGKAELLDKDKVIYTLNSTDFSGLDSFRYVLCPELGCPEACDTAWVLVQVQAGSLEEAMKTMPNFITPEIEDGLNDLFEPVRHLVLRGIIIRSSELLILNRWGEVVHRSEDGRWDGRINGQMAPPATYYYRLVLQTGEQRVVKGAIGVLR